MKELMMKGQLILIELSCEGVLVCMAAWPCWPFHKCSCIDTLRVEEGRMRIINIAVSVL